jgi:hypothetical protein
MENQNTTEPQGPFHIHIEGTTIFIKGDFRYGTAFVKIANKLENDIRDTFMRFTFDLTKVVFMDSDTMAFIDRMLMYADIKRDESSWVYKRYTDWLAAKAQKVIEDMKKPQEHVKHAMQVFNEVLETTIKDFYKEIEHGDDEHKKWLKDKFKEYWGVEV